MRDGQERAHDERDAIAARVARFKAMQEKFAREREEYFVNTLGRAIEPPSAPQRTSPRPM